MPLRTLIFESNDEDFRELKIKVKTVFPTRLHNIVEQSHRKVKGKMHQCLGWKSWQGAESTLAGVELWSMIKLEQMKKAEGMTSWEQFYSLAA